MASLDNLTACFSRLPGIGRKSAERMAVALVRDSGTLLDNMISTLQDAKKTVCCCSLCGSITSTDDDPCRLCTSSKRDTDIICVVEEPGDIVMIEKSSGFHGRYHALMGKISPIKGIGPEDLRVKSLIDRLHKESFKEVIFALSTDVEGDATVSFIMEMLKECKLKVSRLAFGLPAGSAIIYSDPITLAKAIKGRQDV